MTVKPEVAPKTVGVICMYKYKDPVEHVINYSSCYIKVYNSDQILPKFSRVMDSLGRANAELLSYLSDNGRAIF